MRDTDPLETIKYKNHTIQIFQDINPINPRTDYDHAGTMLCVHRNYILGDKPKCTIEDIHEANENPENIVLPIYMYDHGGITISTIPFLCPWDSGQVGIIYISQENAKKEWNTEDYIEHAIECMRAEVNEYDRYLTGQVYGYVIQDSEGEYKDSCFGFMGDMKNTIQEAKNQIDWYVKHEPQQLELPLNN